MSVTITYKDCTECHHFTHSGAYTKGGAKLVCGHSDACVVRAKTHKADKYHWIHRVIRGKHTGNVKIPEWCPLRESKL